MTSRNNFKDHFSGHASSYAAFRPKSPKELFAYLASLAPSRKMAWDAGTGNGQAAIELASYFDRVIATDASAEQIANAVLHSKISYQVAPSENSGLETNCVDLITVAQAVHWFDFEKFYSEVKRVGKPKAVIALWTYELASITPAIDSIVRHYYDVEIGKYWPAERRWVDAHYETLPFPFREIKPPTFQMKDERTLQEWVGYLSTWSATQRAIQDQGTGIFDNFVLRLERAWGDPSSAKEVKWPLYLRLGFLD